MHCICNFMECVYWKLYAYIQVLACSPGIRTTRTTLTTGFVSAALRRTDVAVRRACALCTLIIKTQCERLLALSRNALCVRNTKRCRCCCIRTYMVYYYSIYTHTFLLLRHSSWHSTPSTRHNRHRHRTHPPPVRDALPHRLSPQIFGAVSVGSVWGPTQDAVCFVCECVCEDGGNEPERKCARRACAENADALKL